MPVENCRPVWGHLMRSTPMARSACFPESETVSVSLGSFQQPAELCCREKQSQESQANDFKAEHCFSPVRLLVFLLATIGAGGRMAVFTVTKRRNGKSVWRTRAGPPGSRLRWLLSAGQAR